MPIIRPMVFCLTFWLGKGMYLSTNENVGYNWRLKLIPLRYILVDVYFFCEKIPHKKRKNCVYTNTIGEKRMSRNIVINYRFSLYTQFVVKFPNNFPVTLVFYNCFSHNRYGLHPWQTVVVLLIFKCFIRYLICIILWNYSIECG